MVLRPEDVRNSRWLSWPRNRGAQAIGISVLCGAAVAAILSPRLPGPGDSEGPKATVVLLGQALALNDQVQRVALDRVRRFAAQELELVKPDGSVSPVTLGRIGVQIDKQRLSSLVRQARDPTSAMRQAWLAEGHGKPIELYVPFVFDREALFEHLLHTKDAVDRMPSDARMDLDARKVMPEVDGSWSTWMPPSWPSRRVSSEAFDACHSWFFLSPLSAGWPI